MAENYFGITDTGKTRSNNEDTFIAQKSSDGKYIIACVIDGVGGYNGGEVAAEIARQQIIKHMDGFSGDVISAMIAAFKKSSAEIYLEKQRDKEHESMACVATLAMVDVEANQFYYAHVGDTRLYLLRDGSLIKISRDQSFVGFLEDSGRLSETAAMSHPKRNEINKALGFDNQIDTDEAYIETGQSPFLPGDMLLLCSDGLSDMVDKSRITSIVDDQSTLQQKGAQLIQAANDNGGKDNITVVLVKNDKASQRPAATMPVSKKNVRPQAEDTVIAPSPEPVETPATEKVIVKKSYGTVVLLSILCLLLLASTVWLYLKWQTDSQVVKEVLVITKKPRNAQEIKLQDAINKLTGDTLIISDTIYKSPIVINDSLKVIKDTIVILAKGKVVLQADSAYKGPAFTIASASKMVRIDNLQFHGFETAICVQNTALNLNAVQFINCRSAVQNSYQLPGEKPVSVTFPTIKNQPDTTKTTRSAHGSN